MNTPMPPKRVSPFEAIKHEDEEGEYWSARELAKTLDYTEYGKFRHAIAKAEIACETSGQQVSDHFAQVSDMVQIGSGAKRRVEDVHLSRYACYLIVQNADSSKRIVALGQTYFAAQTRLAEILQDMSSKSVPEQRIILRDQIADANGQLAETATDAQVVTQDDFRIFQDHGWQGLYEMTSRQLASRRGLKKDEHPLDYMGPEESVINLMRIQQTDAKMKRDGVSTPDGANHTHFEVGRVIRRALDEIGATKPEDMSREDKSIQQVRREEARRQQIASEDRMGLWAQLQAGDDRDEE